jgi:hypothetical protein
MKYIAILRQEGEGCDHSIGCGVNTIQFEAENYIEAGKKLKLIVFENYNHDDARLKSLHYYQIDGTYDADVKKWYEEFAILNREKKEKEKELAERMELQRLVKKYGR